MSVDTINIEIGEVYIKMLEELKKQESTAEQQLSTAVEDLIHSSYQQIIQRRHHPQHKPELE